MSEIWKSVPRFEGAYEVSDRGRVRGMDRQDTRGHSIRSRRLKQFISTSGYAYVDLRKDNATHRFSVHDLVMLAFVGSKPPDHQVNHKNGCKWHNHFENLEYATRSENVLHAIHVLGKMRHKRQPPRGEKSPRSKLVTSEIFGIRGLASEGLNHGKIAEVYGVSRSTVSMILRGETWAHI